MGLLVAKAGQPVTYRSIYDQVHYAGFVAGEGERGFERNVRTMIKRLRRKFEAIDPDFQAIRSVVGLGYSWDAIAGSSPRLATRRESMNVRRAMIVEKDHEPQVSGTMDGRHLKITHLMGYSRAHPGRLSDRPVGTSQCPTAATSLEDEVARQGVTAVLAQGRSSRPRSVTSNESGRHPTEVAAQRQHLTSAGLHPRCTAVSRRPTDRASRVQWAG